MALIQTVHLSMANFKSAPVVPAVQNDTDRQVKMIVDDFDLTSGMTGKIAFQRSDGTHYETSATLNTSDNSFTADIDQALTQPGRTMVQLKVTDTLTVSTFSFVIFVEQDNSGTVTPQEGIDLVSAVQAAEDAADRAEAAAETLELDATLTESGKAADAAAVGNAIANIAIEIDDTLTQSGKAADAKVAGDAIRSLQNDLSAVKEVTVTTVTERQTDSILDDLTWTEGKAIGLNGSEFTNSTYNYSSKIAVNPGDVITLVRSYGSYNDMRYVTAYVNGVADSSLGAENKTSYTVPNTVSEVVLSVPASYMNVYTLTHSYDIEVYENIMQEDIEELQAGYSKIENGIAPEMINHVSRTGHDYVNDVTEENTGKYWNGSVGSVVGLSSNATYDALLIPITEEGIYTCKNTSSSMRFIHLLDSDKKVIEVLQNTRTVDTTNKNVSYLAVSVYHVDTAALQIALGDNPSYDQYTVSGEWVFEDLVSGEQAMHLYLPSEICVGVGRTIELYNDLVLLEADKYHINWSCSVGVAYKRKFSITGTSSNVGTYTLTLNIYNDSMSIVKTATATLKIVANGITGTKKIIPIGDSLTNQKAWEPEVQTLSDGKIAYIGTRQGAYAQYKHEGRSGAQAAWYNADSTYTFDSNYVGNSEVDGTKNPFWDGTKFSLEHYIETQADTIGTPDAVQLLLGTNGISIDPTTNVNNIKTIVDNIVAEYPNMPIFVCNTIYRSNQDGYHSTGADGYVPVSDFQFSADVKVMNLQNALAEAFKNYTNVYIVPLSVCMDRDNNFGQVEVPVNPRLTSVTTHIASESVHPQSAGYMQMADVMYSSYIAHLS